MTKIGIFWITYKAAGVAVGAREHGYEHQALDLFLKGTIYIVHLVQSVVGIGIKIDRDGFFKSPFQFVFQGIDKARYPAFFAVKGQVVFLAVTDKDVVLVSFNDGWHGTVWFKEVNIGNKY